MEFRKQTKVDIKEKRTGRVVKSIFVVGITALVVVFVFYAIYLPRVKQQPASIIALKNTEVKEYQGQKLSSVADFIETSIKGPQYVDINKYTLSVEGMVDNKLDLTYDQVLKHDKYMKVVTLNCVEGWSVNILWEGVLLKDLLAQAGVKPGSNTVIFYAYDGYSSSLPLDYIMNENIILADKMNGVVIPPERGFPFMVVAESKWGYKWVKWVTKIVVSDDSSFKGYWEQRGYSNNGDFSGPMFGN